MAALDDPSTPGELLGLAGTGTQLAVLGAWAAVAVGVSVWVARRAAA